jgi:hypothetical protein
MRTLGPYLARYYGDTFNINGLAAYLKISPSKVIAMRRPVPWSDRFFEKSMIHHYITILNNMRFVIFNIRGLGKTLFYDGRQRALYFDVDYYRSMPITHLFHRIMLQLRAVLEDFYVWLHLDTSRHILPFFGMIERNVDRSFTSKMKRIITSQQSHLVIDDQRAEYIRKLFATKRSVKAEEIEKIKAAMINHLYNLQVAETLDLIGVVESLIDRDITKMSAADIARLVKEYPQIQALINQALRLKLK